MRRPKQWNKMLALGFTTTDMIDGCLLQLIKTRRELTTRISMLEKAYEEKPTKTTERRISDARRRLYRAQCKHDFLLGATDLKAIMRYSNKRGEKYHYAIHTLGSNTYVKPLTEKEAKDLAVTANMSITSTRAIKMPAYNLELVPSFATVNEVIATMASAKVKFVADTGNFDPKNQSEKDSQYAIDKASAMSVTKLIAWYPKAQQEIDNI